MYIFKIGFKFVEHFSLIKPTYILAVFNGESDFILKNKSIFTFNDTGLDTHRLDNK